MNRINSFSFSYDSIAHVASRCAKPVGVLAALAALTALVFATYRYFCADAPKSIHKPVIPAHPAEKPTEHDLTLSLPDEVLIMIFELLDQKALIATQSTCKKWNQISAKYIIEARFGAHLAQRLMESRSTWPDLNRDLNSSIQVQSMRLAFLSPKIHDWNPPSALKRICDLASSNDFEALKGALEELRSSGFHHLNNDFHGSPPLFSAAFSGNVRNAQLLVEHGAANALSGTSYCSKDGVKGDSALFCAASRGHVHMVRYLLEQGASPDLNLEDAGYNRAFLPSLISRYFNPHQRSFQPPLDKFLECLLLILKAWKAKIGTNNLSQNEDARAVLQSALSEGCSEIAELMMGFGVGQGLSRDSFSTVAMDGIREGNIPMLEMIHRRQLLDFKMIREVAHSHALLYHAVAFGKIRSLNFLKKIGVPTDVIGTDGLSDFEAGRIQFGKHVCKAILNKTVTFAGFYDKDSNFHFELDELDAHLQSGVDLNISIDDMKNTLLYHAVKVIFYSSMQQLLHKLLDHGANPRQAGSSGITPLMRAERLFNKGASKSCNEKGVSGALAFLERMRKM